LSLYVIPLFLIMLTLWALLFLPNRYPTAPGQSLSIQALASQQEHADPELLTRLRNAPSRQRLHLSEPHWLLLTLPAPFPQQEHGDPQSRTRLRNAPSRQRLPLREPHWLLLTLPPPRPQQQQVLHFPASPISTLHCQDARSGKTLRDSELDPPAPLSPAPV